MLRSLVPWAEGEGRRVALVGGEAGSGKSRLVREFAIEVAERGALVLYGACDAVVHPPYGPFVEAFEQLEAQPPFGVPSRTRRRRTRDTERHRLHTGVAGLLERLARERPVLLVHRGRALGRHAVARAAAAPRAGRRADAGARARHVPGGGAAGALAETLADLRRSDDIVRLRLGGLSTDEVEEFVRRAGGEPEELAGTINALTAGNAFLVCELWRSLADGGQLGTPESVREVVGRRVARLDAGTRDLLEVAATVGPEFGLEVVRLAAESALAPALEEAIATGMIEALPSRAAAVPLHPRAGAAFAL